MTQAETYRALADLGMASTVRPDLPTGTVTFFLSDVEGSTRLWESGAEQAADAIARHYELLDASILRHGGLRPVEQGEGDSVVAVFIRPSDAAAAALDVQRAFAEEVWTVDRPVRIRVALHSGETQLRDAGNYFGPTIIRCARLRAIAHGGQTVMSDATRELVGEALPADASLRDLGPHRLKDLGRSERVWQLVHPQLADDFPPLRSLDTLPTNLPFQMSSFVGREREVAELVEAIGQHRLVTLTGAGGCGKTRLALQAAAETLDDHADGVWSVELAPVSHGDEVARAVARVFGLREEYGRPLIDTLTEQLHDLDLLLVIDNCEQVLSGAAAVVEQLLHAIPRLRVVATSREPLGIEGERTWRVPSLDGTTACELFVDRACQVRPDFAADADELAVIGQIVERLDGIPLAVELAAARTRMMHPVRILGALDDRFRLLTGGGRTVMPRQQTLEASVAWSFDLLDPDEQMLACRLSILHGFGLETAEAVGSDDTIDRYAVLELLTRLVDKSLVQVDHSGGDTRYRFLETVRQFLQGRLVASGEADSVRRRHLDHFLALAEQLAPLVALGDGPTYLVRLELDHDNFDDALEWAESTGQRELLLRLVTALSLFYELRGHLAHGGRWFARALSDRDAEPSSITARALWGAAHVGFYGGDYENAHALASEALSIAETVGDDWAAARALNTLGLMQSLGEPQAARESLERSIAFGASIGDEWAVADGWKMMTVAWYVQHDDVGVQAPMSELRSISERLGSGFFLAWYHAMAGYFARDRGELGLARAELDESLRLCRDVGDPSTGGFAEVWSAALDADVGDLDTAVSRLERLLARAAATGSDLAAPEAVFVRAGIALAQGDPALAIDLTSPVVELIREAGVPGWTAQLLMVLGSARRLEGDLPGAAAALAEAAELAAPIANPAFDSMIAFECGLLSGDEGDTARAENLLHEALTRQVGAGLRPGICRTLEALASIAANGESYAEAVRCLAAADALRSSIGIVRRPVDEQGHGMLLADLREQLGDADFDGHWAAAADVDLAEIVEYVARARGERKRPSSGWASLTPTELRVVALVAEGLTNPQIAERMFIARGTAKVHVSHIFDKLGVTTRAQLAATATARGITSSTSSTDFHRP